MFESLHPAPVSAYAADHREAHNRDQMRNGSEYQAIWYRAVEALAAELQLDPYEAHCLLRQAAGSVTQGQALERWL